LNFVWIRSLIGYSSIFPAEAFGESTRVEILIIIFILVIIQIVVVPPVIIYVIVPKIFFITLQVVIRIVASVLKCGTARQKWYSATVRARVSDYAGK
jgi:hypothetical protein